MQDFSVKGAPKLVSNLLPRGKFPSESEEISTHLFAFKLPQLIVLSTIFCSSKRLHLAHNPAVSITNDLVERSHIIQQFLSLMI